MVLNKLDIYGKLPGESLRDWLDAGGDATGLTREEWEAGGGTGGTTDDTIDTTGGVDPNWQAYLDYLETRDQTETVATRAAPAMTPAQLEIEKLALKQLRQADAETDLLTKFIAQSLRLVHDDAVGGLRRMTDDEYMGTLGATEQQNFRNLQLQIDRQTRALEGTLPVSEGLEQRRAEEFRVFKEGQARRGNIISGDDSYTATANTTAGMQSLNSFNDTYKLAEDAERRGEIQTGQANIGSSLGLMTSQQNVDFTQLSTLPLRNLTALNPFTNQQGLLQQRELVNTQLASQQNLFSQQVRAQEKSDLLGLAGTIGGIGLGYYLTK